MNKYVAESRTMIAGRFGHEGLCQHHHTTPLANVCYITYLTLQFLEFCTQLTKAFVAEMSCNHCY